VEVIQKLESFRIPLLGLIYRLRFRKPIALLLFSVGQVAFSGRTLSDAAKYLYVVLLAGHFDTSTRPALYPEYQKPLRWFDLAP
jgi:hypothetical protein